MKRHSLALVDLHGLLLSILSLVLLSPMVWADTVIYTYDANGRLLKAYYGAGNSIAYTYDLAGNILSETVTAYSGPVFSLQMLVSPAGGGSIAADEITCPPHCNGDIPQNQTVSITATPGAGLQFLGWAGDLSGTLNPKNFLMNGPKVVTAYFGAAAGSTDTDGVTDSLEMGPGGDNPSYDGDGNGVADYQESNVASFPGSSENSYATLAVPEGVVLSGVQAVGNPSPADAPADVSFPYGFFGFTVSDMTPGDCTTVSLYFPLTPTINTYYKYGPTPDKNTPHWYEFMYDGTRGAQIFHEATRTRVVLHLCDGHKGVGDLTTNGTIVEPGGPGVKQTVGTPVPTLNEWAMIITAAMLGIVSLFFLKRRFAVIFPGSKSPSAIDRLSR